MMFRRVLSLVPVALAASVAAETYTIVVDENSITPDTLEVAPGDTILFDSVCAMRVSTGSSCVPDGILSGISAPPFCSDFQWTIPPLATAELPIFGVSFSENCNENRTALLTVVSGNTLAVPGEYTTIGDAIAAAESGDRITIAAGAYFEHDLLIEKTITLQGEPNPDGSPGVKIDAQQQGRVFELVGGGPAPGEPGLIIMDNLVITGGDVDGHGGGVLVENCSPIFRNCLIVENSCTESGGGVHARRDASDSPWVNAAPRFSSCTIRDNSAQDGGGLYCFGDGFGSGCEPELTGCLIIDNTAIDGIGGLRHVGSGQTTVDGSIICGNYPGQYDGNIDLDNNSCTLSQCLDTDGDGIVDDCEGGDEDGILNVPLEYPTLPLAWLEVSDGDTIAMAAGTYVITEVDELRLEDMSISIIGETNPDGTPAVILDGLNTNNFFYLAILGQGAGQSSIENIHFMRFGSGVGFADNAATIRNCIIEDGYGQTSGLYLRNFQGTVEGCRIINNSGYGFYGGVALFDAPDNPASNVTLVDCVIQGNSGSGPFGSGGCGGVYCDGGTSVDAAAHFIGCIVAGNTSSGTGGIQVLLNWNVTLTDTTVCANSTPEQIVGAWEDLGGNSVGQECPAACPGDIDGNGEVGVDDLLLLLGEYGTDCSSGCDSDLDGDGAVNVDDLLEMLGYYGDTC
ncbi:MAG: right-handed parallel beta-helix repeat-containing protein [Phycisphaerales bacterium]|nr:right-handed parallel beta-helix repeat-containing protein [Phycisphaerales bacterium]